MKRWLRAAPFVTLALATVSCAAAGSFPPSPHVVDVDMREYSFGYNGSIPSGPVVFRAHNMGQADHELVLVILPDDFPNLHEQLHAEEREAVATLASLATRRPGTRGTFAVDMTAGRYGFVCFTLDADGIEHALKGMNSEFRVE